MRTAMTTALLLVALLACDAKTKQQHQPPPLAAGRVIDIANELAEKVCACQTDRECLHGMRDAWDAQKEQLLESGAQLTGDDKTNFDAAIGRMKMCGDGGGLTFWDH